MSVTVLKEITEKVGPPRALFVDRPLGYPLGAPNDRGQQTNILRQAFALLSREVSAPLVVDYRDSGSPGM